MYDNHKIHPIGFVARQTGLSVHVIRAWEKRYGVVQPGRTPTGRRLYSESDIQHLKLLRQAAGVGHRIAQLSELDDKTLLGIVGKPVADNIANEDHEGDLATPADLLEACHASVANLDEQTFEATLNRAAVMLTRPRLFEGVLLPLVAKIGDRWADGELKTINEHMASSILVSFLREMLTAYRPAAAMPRMVVATPANHWHELGALIAAITAAEAGWHAYYFGPNLPAEEIAAAAVYKKAVAVTLSIVYHGAERQTLREIKRLRQYVAKDVTIIVGGRGMLSCQADLKQLDVSYLQNFSEFRDTISKLA
ncbi:MAG: MerR family transcriptional regulator [Desulfobacterales bacterium]|jgi:DNA-binding transcriptional MerR regulator/methylmalonyl-CoA mutase cobalamin-binding subunit